jgi:hypothetical protein
MFNSCQQVNPRSTALLALCSIAVNKVSPQRLLFTTSINQKVLCVMLLFITVSPAYAEDEHQDHDQKNSKKHQRPSFASLDHNNDNIIDFDEFSLHKLPHGDPKSVFQ